MIKKNIKIFISVSIVTMILALVLIFNFERIKVMSNPESQTINIHFGRKGVQDLSAYTNNKSDDYARIMSFYELNWRPPTLGKVNIQHAGKNLVINHIFYLMATKLNDRFDGIGALDISGGLNEAEFVDSRQAYQGYVDLMKELNSQGWQQLFQPNEARYSRQDNLKILLGDFTGVSLIQTGTTSDTSQILSYQDWQKIFNTGRGRIWSDLYLRDIMLHLEIEKTPSSKDINNEQYIVSYKFNTAKYRFYTGLTSEQRNFNNQDLKVIYDNDANENKRAREQEENDAKKAGFHIDESYKDPNMWQYIIEPVY